MNPKKGLKHPRSYQAPPDVSKSYVSVFACCYDSPFWSTPEVGKTSDCKILLSQLLERLVVYVKHTYLMQEKNTIFMYIFG